MRSLRPQPGSVTIGKHPDQLQKPILRQANFKTAKLIGASFFHADLTGSLCFTRSFYLMFHYTEFNREKLQLVEEEG